LFEITYILFNFVAIKQRISMKRILFVLVASILLFQSCKKVDFEIIVDYDTMLISEKNNILIVSVQNKNTSVTTYQTGSEKLIKKAIELIKAKKQKIKIGIIEEETIISIK
jgi:hypothetical protein